MKPTELRIGNLVMSTEDKTVVAVTARFLLRFSFKEGELSEYYKPIPISPKWIEKLGFAKDKIYDYWVNDSGLKLWHDGTGFYHINSETLTYFNAVHEVQNYCFAVAKEELTVKQ